MEKFVVGGVVGWGGLSDFSVYSLPSFNQKWNDMSRNCLEEATRALEKFVVEWWHCGTFKLPIGLDALFAPPNTFLAIFLMFSVFIRKNLQI